MERCRRLLNYVESNHLPFDIYEDKEVALLGFFDEEFAEGREVPDGTKTWAAFQHLYPRHGRFGAEPLARVNRAHQGWSKLAPAHGRFPLPEEVVSALAIMIVLEGYPIAGLMVLVA